MIIVRRNTNNAELKFYGINELVVYIKLNPQEILHLVSMTTLGILQFNERIAALQPEIKYKGTDAKIYYIRIVSDNNLIAHTAEILNAPI